MCAHTHSLKVCNRFVSLCTGADVIRQLMGALDAGITREQGGLTQPGWVGLLGHAGEMCVDFRLISATPPPKLFKQQGSFEGVGRRDGEINLKPTTTQNSPCC